ncbi:MAG: YbdD/YjiX family protein [Gemmatimonadaceae bacterium]|nr:YbdD/YjiX family protein [Gemmatimonadaceae bacterium]
MNVHAWLARLGALIRRIIGVPDYEAYLAHMRACHPSDAPLDRTAFAAERLDARYSKPGARCC